VNFDFHVPTRILFGRGSLNDLSRMELPGKKALVVISAGKSMRENGYLDRVVEALGRGGAQSAVFARVQPNPVVENVMDGRDMFLREGCDFVVGLGGGSTVDCAKSIAVVAGNPEYGVWDYIGDTEKGKALYVQDTTRDSLDIMMPHRIKTPYGWKRLEGAYPVVAITTTAGTGSEADPWCVTTNTQTQEKLGMGGDCTFPQIAVVDPELMVSVPRDLTVYQGFDALFHCMETYFGRAGTRLGRVFCAEGIREVCRFLERAASDGGDIEAREGMAYANLMGAFALSDGSTCAMHAIAETVGAYAHGIPHGAALICLSEPYFALWGRRRAERLPEIGGFMGVDADALEEDDRYMAPVRALSALKKACGVDKITLLDWKLDPNDLQEIARKAKEGHMRLFRKDPAMLEEGEVVEILRGACGLGL